MTTDSRTVFVLNFDGEKIQEVPRVTGSVIEFTYGPVVNSYFATSYPHRAEYASVQDKRKVAQQNIPPLILKKIALLRPRYVMNLAFRPNTNTWFIFCYRDRFGYDAKWEPTKPSEKDPIGESLDVWRKEARDQVSACAFGEFEGTWFMRSTDPSAEWHLQLGSDVPRTLSVAFLDAAKHTYTAQKNNGREIQLTKLRAVTFGHDSAWILYSKDSFWWSDRGLPEKLVNALELGREQNWVINKAVLNPQNAYEYVLVYDHGPVYCSFQRDFKAPFREILEEWSQAMRTCGKFPDHESEYNWEDPDHAETESRFTGITEVGSSGTYSRDSGYGTGVSTRSRSKRDPRLQVKILERSLLQLQQQPLAIPAHDTSPGDNPAHFHTVIVQEEEIKEKKLRQILEEGGVPKKEVTGMTVIELMHTIVTALQDYARSWRKRWGAVFRPRLCEGWTRIVWTCSCGDELYADFKEKSPGSLKALADQLGGVITSPEQPISGETTSGSPTFTPRTPNSDWQNRDSAQHRSSQSTTSPIPPAFLPDPIRRSSFSAAQIPSSIVTKYLELCSRNKDGFYKLGEVNVSSPRGLPLTDRVVFHRIKAQYEEDRIASRFLGALRTWKPVGGHFVQFQLDKRPNVVVRNKGPSMPPKEEVDHGRYYFEPNPVDFVPPVPPEIFVHFLERITKAHAEVMWTPKFPHKMNESFYSNADPLAIGWGIQIEEGRDWNLFCVLNLIALLVSGGVAALYAFLNGDKTTAVAIGTWLTGVQTLIVAIAFFFSH